MFLTPLCRDICVNETFLGSGNSGSKVGILALYMFFNVMESYIE